MQYMIDHSYNHYPQLKAYVRLGVNMIKIWASVGAASIYIYMTTIDVCSIRGFVVRVNTYMNEKVRT